MQKNQALMPRAAYLHVPFCSHRCGYCNFALVANRDDLIEKYLQAIDLELSKLASASEFCAIELDTLYYGGGTPTYLSSDQLTRLNQSVLKVFTLSVNYEWTVEANPEDLRGETIEFLASQGANRVSLGVQSFRDEKLKQLERSHCQSDIESAARKATQHGLALAIDLMFAAPGETLEQWQTDLEQAVAMKPEHLSTYGLTYERGTQFWSKLNHGQLAEADEDLQREMYELAIDFLTDAGYEHYEVSNFAIPGKRSRHNEAYWFGKGYFAAGPGAARYVENVRETNHRSTTTYIKRMLAGESPVAERSCLDDEARARELLVFALRRIEGVSHQWFEEQTGTTIDSLVGDSLRQLIQEELLTDDGQTLKLTRDGLLVSDSIWPEII